MTGGDPLRPEALLAAAEREQRRMAAELHETLCQYLVGIALLAQTLSRRVEAGRTIGPGDLQKLNDYAGKAIDETRFHFHDRAVLAGTLRLREALEKMAARAGKRVTCAFEGKKAARTLSLHASFVLYRIAQEAVRNALRHAEAGTIVIGLGERRGVVTLTISDDGRGMGKRAPADGSWRGLEMMDAYARSIGAKLAVESRRGKGTTITVTAPIRAGG